MKRSDACHFWKWFMRHNQTLLHLDDGDECELEYWNNEMLVHIKAVCPNGVEMNIIANENNNSGNLVLTSFGDQKYFEEIEVLYKERPCIEGWDIYALYPPMVMHYQIDCLPKDINIDPEDLYFNPVQTETIEGEFHLIVWSGDTGVISNKYTNAVKRVLLNLLGERFFAYGITSFTIKPLKELSEQIGEDLFPLEFLPDWMADNLFSAFEVNEQGLIVPRTP